jgi:hypothetical protein
MRAAAGPQQPQREPRAHPALEVGYKRGDARTPHHETLIDGATIDLALHLKDRVNTLHRFECERRDHRKLIPRLSSHVGKLEELAPAMRPAARLGDRAGAAVRRIEPVESGIGIGLQDPCIAGEMTLRMLRSANGSSTMEGGAARAFSRMAASASPITAAERALRGIALGRKSWLFAGSDRGGERAAVMYTLIQTARLNDVDPQAWLADVLAGINDHSIQKLDQMLPWNWKTAPARLAA